MTYYKQLGNYDVKDGLNSSPPGKPGRSGDLRGPGTALGGAAGGRQRGCFFQGGVVRQPLE